MTIAATGPNGDAMQRLATLASGIAAWQTACGVSSAAAALESVHYPHLQDEDQCQRPALIISRTLDGGFSADRTSGGGKNGFLLTGTLRLRLIDTIHDFEDEKDPDVLFHNLSDAVVKGLLDGAAVSDNLAISRIQATIAPSRSDDTDVSGNRVQAPRYEAEWLIEWSQC